MSANLQIKELIKRHLKVLSWEDTYARVECPSGSDHPDCVVWYSTLHVHDFHEVCQNARRAVSAELWEDAGDDRGLADQLKDVEPDPELIKWRARLRKVEETARRYLLPKLPEVPIRHWLEISPVPVEEMNSQEQFIAIIRGLFYEEQKRSVQRLIWTGNKTDSGQEEASVNFKEAQEWVRRGSPYGQFLGLHEFRTSSGGMRHRSNVLLSWFSLAESDDLTLEKFGGVVQYIAKYFTLRALILTGGRSMHAVFDWFVFRDPEYPAWKMEFGGKTYDLDHADELRHEKGFYDAFMAAFKAHDGKVLEHKKACYEQSLKKQEFIRILCGLGCDRQMLANAMMCRCPGVERLDNDTGAPTRKFQRLIYLNPRCQKAYANS